MPTAPVTAPFTGTVLFTVSAQNFSRDQQWMVRTVETGIVTFGATLDDAQRVASAANVALVKRWKLRGETELKRLLTERNIRHSLDGRWEHEAVEAAAVVAA